MSSDLSRAVDYFGQLHLALYISVAFSAFMAMLYLIDCCRERRRQMQSERFYAQMHGVCADYR